MRARKTRARLSVARTKARSLAGPKRAPLCKPDTAINITTSSSNSQLNFLLCIPVLQIRKALYLGVHETGSRPGLCTPTADPIYSESYPSASK